MQKDKKEISLLSRWKSKRHESTKLPRLNKAPSESPRPLSHGQRRIWILQQLYPQNPFYNYTETFEFTGPLQIELLKKSLEFLTSAHGILRTSVQFVDGMVCQQVHRNLPARIEICDLSHLDSSSAKSEIKKAIDHSAGTVFDLKNPPLTRYNLLKLSRQNHILVVTMHHMVMDAWSMEIFRQQLCEYYKNLLNDIPPIIRDNELDYTDFAYWEQSLPLDSVKLTYWKNKLGGDVPLLKLPFDFQRPLSPTYKGAQDRHIFSKELSTRILTFCKERKITPYVFFLSLFYVLLYRYCRQQDLIIGSPVSNRNSELLEHMMGFFSETMVLRIKLNPSFSFLAFLEQVRETTLQAFSNRDVPFDAIVKELGLKRSSTMNPLFQVMFLYHSYAPNTSMAPGLTLNSDYPDTGVSKFDLTLFVFETDGMLSTMFEYSTELFHESTIRRMQKHLMLLVEALLKDPSTTLAKVPMATSKELDFFTQNASTVSPGFPGFSSIDRKIDSIGRKFSTKIAVAAPDRSLSYGELLDYSELVAKFLYQKTKGNNEVIGLCFKPSAEFFIGLLGILKAGCAYLPLDPVAPAHRNKFMLNDAGASLLLTSKDLAGDIRDNQGQVILLENILTKTMDEAATLPEVTGRALAYIIYTSGSTGKPKGVPITHSNIISSTAGRLDFYPESPGNFLLMSPPTFDSSKAGIFWTLCTGGTLTVLEKHSEQDVTFIESIIQDHSITHTLMLPSLYLALLSVARVEKFKSLHTVIVAGEACTSFLCQQHYKKLPSVSLYNEYGPTEATVWCVAHRVSQKDLNGPVPIGKPVAGAQVYLLDDELDYAVYGSPADLYIGGPGVSPGYLHRPELNEKVFIDHPIFGSSNEKIYRTGDMARYNKEGNIEFLGRADQQVKIRGYRIELQEIENTIKGIKEVDKAVVLAHEYQGRGVEPQPATNTPALLRALQDTNMPESELEALLYSVESLGEEEQNAILRELYDSGSTDPT